jgi:hypothetical protein
MRRLLAILLLVWEPLNLALAASHTVATLDQRGWLTSVWLVVRLAVAGVGIAAGMLLWQSRPGAIRVTRLALMLLLLCAAALWALPFAPRNLPPGVRGPVVSALVAWHAAWLVWALRQRD